MWIEVGSIVIIADSGVAGAAEFSVMALLSDDEVRDVRNTLDLSPRIFDISEVDSDSLLSNKPNLEAIIEFGEEEVNVDDV